MKKHFIALLKALEDILPKPVVGEATPRVIMSPKSSKRKGFRVINPTPFVISELQALVDACEKGWIIDNQLKPTQNKTSGEWYQPSVFVGQPFATKDRDEMFAEMQDWE